MTTCSTCQNSYPDDFLLCPRDGTRLDGKASETQVRLTAGLARRFHLVRRLGAGGMGTVFLAEQIGVGNRLVALKVLNRNLLAAPDFVLRFQNEAGSTGRIHHANVVTIYESAQTDDGTPYIAMEFLEGISLREEIKRRGALPVAEVAEILQQAARGLNAAHKLGIIHRDIKPDNIFLTRGEEGELVVKLLDFGVAKLRESAMHTQTGMVLGTPPYMSSEQAYGMRSDELDARSDIFSLGVVVYEMLIGRTPFRSDTPVGYLRMHMQDPPPAFRDVAPGLAAPPEVEAAVMKALTKNRDERYATALDFARDFVHSVSISSQAPAPTHGLAEVVACKDREGVEHARVTPEKAEGERHEDEKAAPEQAPPDQAEQERLAHEKAEAERLQREKAAADRLVREKAERERLAREKAETEAQLAAAVASRFHIIRRLGAGSMGTVFLAEQTAAGNRPVALKVLKRRFLDHPDFARRFQSEAVSISRIHHLNVVTLYEATQSDDGTPYIAMEFLEGESVREVLERRRALPAPEVAEILQQAAQGLNAAHELGIIHCDLKPENIFLTPGEKGGLVVKVMDFGIARLRESARTPAGMLLGTPRYMSAEQVTGMKSDELDARSDVYSLGVVVYEMLTGRLPFHLNTPAADLCMHMLEGPPAFRIVAQGLDVPPGVEAVVAKALKKGRQERYQSILEFAQAFASAALPPLAAGVSLPLPSPSPDPLPATPEDASSMPESASVPTPPDERAQTAKVADAKGNH